MLKHLQLIGRKFGTRKLLHYVASSIQKSSFSSQELCPRFAAKSTFSVGNEIAGFRVREVRDVESLQLTAFRLEHLKTGADYLHVARSDPNNVFSIYFRTPPSNSTGVPHILEHSVLCGSEKFPCRDPFFKMLNRSLSTFMNAMTGNDYTLYPFSTQNPIDFRNLMSVYLDAVFKPKLQELDFLQEGWRLEHENIEDPNSPIVLKGVVLNEMKGVFADPQTVFVQKLQNLMLPSDTYGHISGGDPLCIPDLTWAELKAFHAHHYHPSNSRIYTYGDQPLEGHLQYLNENYLDKFERISPNTAVLPEKNWNRPQRATITCSPDPMASPGRQTTVAVSYMLTNINDSFDNFVLNILSELLMGGPNSAFYKTLLEPQIGSGFSPCIGFDDSTLNTTFTVGLQGISTDDLDKVIHIVESTFETVASDGFTEDQIEAVLHNIELGIKHQTSSFGLGIAMKISAVWNHGANPLDSFAISERISKFRSLLKSNPNYLKKKVKQYFLANDHKLVLSMSPSDDHRAEQEALEKNLLENKTKNLTQKDIETIKSLGKQLAEKQESKDDLSVLPTLCISDLTRDGLKTPFEITDVKGTPVHLYEQPTNGVVYFRSILSINDLPSDLLPYVPLFASVLTRMGTGKYDFKSFDQKTELVSGGLGADIHIAQNHSSYHNYEQGILLSSHCLSKNFNKSLDLWLNLFNDFKFSNIDRFSTLIKMIATDGLNNMIHQGHRYATTFSASHINYVANIQERWGGLTYLNLLKELSESSDLSNVLDKIDSIAKHTLQHPKMRVNVNYSPGELDSCMDNLTTFIGGLDGVGAWENSFTNIPGDFSPQTCNNHHVFPFPVNYVSKSFPTVPFTHEDTGSLQVLGRLMFHYLHREIREKGGAYGGGTMTNPGGSFNFYSYRDPHSVRTLQAFESSINWVLSGDFDQREIDEAKLGVFQKLDSPISPGMRGLRNFCSNISDEQYNNMRCSVLDADRDGIVKSCQIYLKNSLSEGTCLIGPENEALSQETKQNWGIINH